MTMRRIFLILFAFTFVFFVTTPAFAAARTLVVGTSGADVTALQQALITKGYLAAGNAVGYFGQLTLAAVKKFQCAQAIVCSGDSSYGVAGPKTQAAAFAPKQPATTGGAPLTGPWTGKFEYSGWVTDWNASTSTNDTLPHLSQLTSVMPFGYGVSGAGKLIDKADITQAPWPAFIAAAKAQHVRVVPTIMWGDGAAIQTILSNTATRIALEDEIANTVKQNGFDGIDIDFEAKQAETINYFSTFLKGLYARMGNKWVYCTIEARMPLEDRYSPGATIPPDATQYANDFTQMNKYCDRVEVMAYDQGTIDVRLNTARSAPYAPVADPGWVEDLITLAAQSIAKSKLVVGVPTYGYEYQVTPQGGGGYKYQRLWAFTPKYALQTAAQYGITPGRTSANEIGFVYNPSNASVAVGPAFAETAQTQESTPTTSVAQNLGSQVNTLLPFNYMTWSDAQAIADKVALAKRLGVRGVAVFSFGSEDQNMWSVLK
jgi:spore germination protein YaaH